MPARQPIIAEAILAHLEESARRSQLEERLAAVEGRLALLESAAGSVTLYINTFAPEPYELKRPIPISVFGEADRFVASFVEANVNASGCSRQEAFWHARGLILDLFDSLTTLPASLLGPRPAQQLAVLSEYMDAAPSHQGTRR